MEALNPKELIREFKDTYDKELLKAKIASPVEVKICGLTSEADAGLLIKYGADYGGVVVFYPKSKRDVTIKEAKIIVDILKNQT